MNQQQLAIIAGRSMCSPMPDVPDEVWAAVDAEMAKEAAMADEDDEFGQWCEDIGQEHDWSEWAIGPYFPREERFCSKCGGMETQEIR